MFLGTFFNLTAANGIKHNEADTILKDPTSCGDNAIKPFLIRIKELPQIRDNPTSIAQARAGVFCMPAIYSSPLSNDVFMQE